MAEPLSVFIPPGLYGNGTPYTAAGRYSTGNLVRFENGFARPIGGWERRRAQDGAQIAQIFTGTDERARNMLSWRDLNGATHIVIGTNEGLYEVGAAGVISDITPAGFTPGDQEGGEIAGYGIGLYGVDAYGTPRTGTGFRQTDAASWSLDLFGEILMAQFRGDGNLYKWQPSVDAIAQPVAQAPSNSQAVVVTKERITMVIDRGSRTVTWSDQEDFTDWTPTLTNSSGSQTLGGQGELIAAKRVGDDILILSTKDTWVAKYVGPPYIYSFRQIGEGCGSLAPNSLVEVGGVAFWVADGGIWTYQTTATKLEAEVDDWFADKIAGLQISKCTGHVLPGKREIWWFFQTTEADDCDAYLSFSYEGGNEHWSYGYLDRTVGIPPGPNTEAIYVDHSGHLWNHELEGTAIPDGYDDFAETGPIQIGDGGNIMGVSRVYPDLTPEFGVTTSGVDDAAVLEILAQDYPSPNTPERVYGPFPLDRPISTTGVRGREIRLRYKGQGRAWRGGKQRLEVKTLGQR